MPILGRLCSPASNIRGAEFVCLGQVSPRQATAEAPAGDSSNCRLLEELKQFEVAASFKSADFNPIRLGDLYLFDEPLRVRGSRARSTIRYLAFGRRTHAVADPSPDDHRKVRIFLERA